MVQVTRPAPAARTTPATTTASRPRRGPGPTWGRHVVGGFYLMMAGIHVGLVTADAEVYRHFADGGLFAFVRDGWRTIVMAHPVPWIAALVVGEAAIGVLLLLSRRTARWGWWLVIGFQLLLMLFGLGFWIWSVPALGLVWLLSRADLGTPREGS